MVDKERPEMLFRFDQMKDKLIQLPKSDHPMFKRIADAIRNSIRNGTLQPSDTLPSTRELAAKYKVHRHTIMNAVGELIAEGWIETQNRSRYRVTSTLPSTFLQAKKVLHAMPLVEPYQVKIQRPIEDSARVVPENFKHQFPSGMPDLRLFPTQELKSHFYDSLSSSKNLGYGDPRGHPKLIEQIQTYIRHVRNVSDREVIVTNGSQEAIFILAQILIARGEYVGVESLGYPPAIAALKFAGAKLLSIPVDAEGLDVDYLERLLKTKRIRMLYLTPLHQYPTTVTLSAGRRLKLYELACKHGFLILEDDYDHEFHYDSQPMAPLASFDPAQLVLYVSTFSKVLFPSARVGFMAVPPEIAQSVAKLKRISSRQNETLTQDAVARWMQTGGFERHLRRMRRTYEERRNGIDIDLNALLSKWPNLEWKSPEGGMALWLNTGENTDILARSALLRGVYVTPESWYRIDKKPGHHLRLGFTGQTVEENTRSLKALFRG